jgi:hypothetical protein
LSATFNSSPVGYAYPNDGSTSTDVPESANPPTASSNNVRNSEIRQSLWLNPQSNRGVNNIENFVSGYYADGFFDRRQIVASTVGEANSVVSTHNNSVAYRGGLFYNPATNASLFFPMQGYRGATVDGSLGVPLRSVLGVTGQNGRYWTTSFRTYATNTGYNVWSLNITLTDANVNSMSCTHGFSIRCVRNK